MFVSSGFESELLTHLRWTIRIGPLKSVRLVQFLRITGQPYMHKTRPTSTGASVSQPFSYFVFIGVSYVMPVVDDLCRHWNILISAFFLAQMFVILGHRSLLKLNDEHFVLRALLVLLISKAVMFHPLQTTFLRDWILFIDDTVTNVILVILSRNFLSSFRALQWLFFVVRCCRVIDSRELIYIHVKRVSTLLQIYISFFLSLSTIRDLFVLRPSWSIQ